MLQRKRDNAAQISSSLADKHQVDNSHKKHRRVQEVASRAQPPCLTVEKLGNEDNNRRRIKAKSSDQSLSDDFSHTLITSAEEPK